MPRPKKRAKIVAICLASLGVLLAVLVIGGGHYESWRATRDWLQCKADLEARGEHLDLAYFVPPPVPDDKNLALSPLMTPLLEIITDPKTGERNFGDPNAPLEQIVLQRPSQKAFSTSTPGNWQTGHFRSLEPWRSNPGSGSAAEDIVAALQKYDPTLAQLRAEMQARPLCRFPLNYKAGVGMALPHLTVLKSIVYALAMRASAQLALNRPDQAFDDVLLAYHLIDRMRDEPTAIDGLARILMVAILQQPVWEGIASHRWSAEQLAVIEQELRGWDFLAESNRSMRYERCVDNQTCDQFRNDPKTFARVSAGGQPSDVETIYKNALTRSWWTATIYRNEISIDTIFQEQFLTIIDENARTVSVQRAHYTEGYLQAIRGAPYTVLVKMMLPVFTGFPQKYAIGQTYLDEAAIACEIERYRLAHGALPVALDDLQMANLPRDVINGQPLHYRVIAPDNYLLYSVGWNETDDGGKVQVNDKGIVDNNTSQQGDWVWTLKPL
ncbi:MAG TPA: hypothetical protein VG733_10510 [Chthoniobacteraceae bacterium]|nr:hypothetical protein [Chthoniobacteraceae bacterium]